ncbi:MAG TPA: ADP-forming succinate--CoA ligase subunit beta [Methylophilaceae bacterium]|nr:ADP-forming succinate--CoA ligase subunit beta [Methylophilaceae bacterium]
MNLHEFQAKHLLQHYGLAIPKGEVVDTADAATLAAKQIGGDAWVVKAQIHAGGRGKSGGVKLVRSNAELRTAVESLIGKPLVTYQNAPDGQLVTRVLVEQTLPIARELYLSLLVDRSLERVVMVASASGGMDIEEIAAHHPEQILQEVCDPLNGLVDFQARNLAFGLGLVGDQVAAFTRLAKGLYRLFKENDLSLLEINPLVVTTDGALVALDCKISIDDNALYRQKALAEQRDWSQDDAKEAQAHSSGLNYIALNGNIGCMVNGAGLAMATMDIIKLYGAEPANFLDVGGGASKEKVTAAFKIITADPNVKGILVNIFGGIMRCDIIAEGVVAAVKEVGLKVPLVVRLEGTNVTEGKAIINNSGLNVIAANDLADAAEKVVKAVRSAA